MNIFVVNAYEDRKYKYDEERYQLYDAVWWEDVTEEQTEDFHFRHNAKMDLRKKVVACTMSHMNLLKKIITDKLEDVVILEDDCVIKDGKRLEELKGTKEFCYIGGQINAPLMKDFKKFEAEKDAVRDNFSKGINVIDPKEFRVAHACSYYIPNADVARHLLSNMPNGKKMRCIDTEYILQQKKDRIKKFMYPALAVLNLDDAVKGFTYSGYKLYDNQEFY